MIWDGSGAKRTYDITSNELTSKDLLLLAITDNNRLHGNITLERGNDIGGLLLLVPTDNRVKHKNTNNDTEINPVTQTSSQENSKFHNCREKTMISH